MLEVGAAVLEPDPASGVAIDVNGVARSIDRRLEQGRVTSIFLREPAPQLPKNNRKKQPLTIAGVLQTV